MSNWKKGKQLNDGQYTIESILLRSSVGLAYRAKENQTGRLVIIKVANPAWRRQNNGADIETKLIQQAIQIANCHHPYLVNLDPEVANEGEQLYMIMDYLEGEDLASYIDRKGTLDEGEALKLIIKIASAVNLLHQNKCTHQHLKPQNILLEKISQQPMLADYGSAIKMFTMTARKGQTNLMDHFSPPEQYSQLAKIAPYSDVYSLAATLYVLVTAQLPNPAKLRQYKDLTPPQQLNPNLSDRLNQGIIKGMALNPAQRPQYLRDWLQLLKDNRPSPSLSPKIQPQSSNSQKSQSKIVPTTRLSPMTGEETVSQKTAILRAGIGAKPASIIYPTIGTFDFETIKIKPKKGMLGLINTVEKQMISRKSKFFVEYLGEGINLEMIFIPSGTFMMGSSSQELRKEKDENPQHLVKSTSFYMSKYPVTQSQWRIVSSFDQVKRPIKSNPSFFKGDNLPVEKVSWLDAQEFCQRLNKYTQRKYRLPTESEWEYACRGGTTTPFFFGDIITNDFANYDGREGYNLKATGKYEKKTSPVGSFYPNPFGLYDLHGNVWEWCEDHYSPNYTHKPRDGSAFYSNMMNQPRVVRGGSWSLSPAYCRSAKRTSYSSNSNYNFLGFRVVCVLE